MVMVFAGTDPSGGAGLQADLLTLSSLGCHTLSAVTALTIQDTVGVSELIPIPTAQVIAQSSSILADIPLVAVFKMGLLGSADTVKAITAFLGKYPEVPVVLDPVLAAGNGDNFANDAWISALRQLLPRVTVVTPNVLEAARLVGDTSALAHTPLHDDTYLSWASRLQDWGVRYVLITGTHDADTRAVQNRLYSPATRQEEQGGLHLDIGYWPRLAGSYHGSGCTLASAIAGYLAQGLSVIEAVRYAQTYTWVRLHNAFYPGQGQALPGLPADLPIEKSLSEYMKQMMALGYEAEARLWKAYFSREIPNKRML